MNVVLQHFNGTVLRLIDVNEPSRDDVFDSSVVIGQGWVRIYSLLDRVTAVISENV